LLADSFLVGFPPTIGQNCRHPTPQNTEKCLPRGGIGVR
jgi:hypothetical protein